MPSRKLVEHLEYRAQVWRFAIRVLREVHNQRFPGGRSFGRDLDLVVAYGFAFISISKHGRVRLSTLSQKLGMPLETARRKLHQLVELGLLRRDGRDFRLGAAAMKMPDDKRIMEDQLRRAVRIAHIGKVQVLHSMMDSPALLWVCQPDGTGMIHNPAWCDNYGMDLIEAAEAGNVLPIPMTCRNCWNLGASRWRQARPMMSRYGGETAPGNTTGTEHAPCR